MKIGALIASLVVLALGVSVATAEEKPKAGGAKKSPPPMLVAVDEVVAGNAEPMQELVGTVYYSRVSNVAAEVEGLVASVAVEDGDRVKAGGKLLSLQIDFLETAYVKARALYEQAQVELEQARKDLARLESLYTDKLIAETTYDSQLAKVRGLEKRVEGLGADVQRLYLEKEKMDIRAPFGGLVLKREVEKGEWVNAGSTVAVVADDREVDIIIDLPERLIAFLEKGREISVVSGNKTYTGEFVALVPKGDIATRTFSIKIRLKNKGGLIEGMAARAMLPASAEVSGLLVPRDAVINKFGREVVFVVADGQAKMVPVEVTGYSGMQLSVKGDGLEAGQKVITKGQERIFKDGTPVRTGS